MELKNLIDILNLNENDVGAPDIFQNSPYIDDENFINIMKNRKNLFLLLSLNIQSLAAKIDELKIYLEKYEQEQIYFSVISMQETWITENSDLPQLNLPGYNLIQKTSSCSTHGGVAFYISKHYKYNILEISKVSEIWDGLFVQIEPKEMQHSIKKKLIIGNIYRPPRDITENYEIFTREIDEILIKLQSNNNEVVIVGDFNIDLLRINERQVFHNYFETIISNGFVPKITLPTRISKNSSTLIDNILMKLSADSEKTTCGILQHNISDHQPCFVALNYVNTKYDKIKYIKINPYTHQNILNFKKDIEQLCNINQFNKSEFTDPNLNYDKINEIISITTKKHFSPLEIKFHKYRHKRSPWITQGIINSIKFRDKLYVRLKKSSETDSIYFTLKTNLKTYNRILKANIRKAKNIHYENIFSKFKNNIKTTWTIIKNIINGSQKSKEIPKYFLMDNKKITDNFQIANEFNKYFINVGPNIAKSIQPTPNKTYEDYLKHAVAHKFNFQYVTKDDVHKIIDRLKGKTSHGVDGLSDKLLKLIKYEISDILTHTINQSLANGIFPDKLKRAQVIPIYKKENDNLFSNYRPISILPSISKVFERVMHNQLHEYFETHKLYFSSQYGFRNSHSTELAALELINRNISSMDKSQTPINIFLDLSKAFDTIDHKILIKKLSHYGVSDASLDLFISYFHNRKQCVHMHGKTSNYETIKSGVPQGSILGPLLFLIYVNDITQASNLFYPILFADDTTLTATLNIFQNKNCSPELVINDELSKINTWLKLNKLSLNLNKTKAMIFHNDKRKMSHPNINFQGNAIEFVDEILFLGIKIDKYLSWKPHLYYITKKISKMIGIMNKLKRQLPLKILRTLYNTMIMPHLTYGILVWGSEISILTNLQKKAVRIMTRSHYFSHTEPLIKSLHLLKVTDLHVLHELKFCYKLENRTLPDYFQNSLFIKNFQNHHYNTRNRRNFQLPKIQHEFAKASIKFKIPHCFNTSPKCIIDKIYTQNQKNFTKYAKIHLISKYADRCNAKNCFSCQN